MFDKLFRRKPAKKVASQPVGEVFAWPKETVLIPHDRLVLALPLALVEADEVMSNVIDCDDAAEIAIPEGDDKIYFRLQPSMRISIRKSAQAMILPWAEGETNPKRIEVVNSSTASE